MGVSLLTQIYLKFRSLIMRFRNLGQHMCPYKCPLAFAFWKFVLYDSLGRSLENMTCSMSTKYSKSSLCFHVLQRVTKFVGDISLLNMYLFSHSSISLFWHVMHSGPYRANGCPLRRVDQTYVIATKTRVDISNVNVPERVNDAYFRRQAKARKSKSEGEMFEEKNTVSL